MIPGPGTLAGGVPGTPGPAGLPGRIAGGTRGPRRRKVGRLSGATDLSVTARGGRRRANVSAVEREPAQLVAQPLVVEHELPDLVGESGALPLALARPAASRSSSGAAARAALIA